MDSEQYLAGLCSQLSLTDAETASVLLIVDELRQFEANKNFFISGSSRVKSLQAVQNQCRSLREVMGAVDTRDVRRVGWNLNDNWDWPGEYLRFTEDVDFLAHQYWRQILASTLKIVEAAAAQAAADVPLSEQRPGPTSRVGAYATYVANLAHKVCRQDGLHFGRGGDFEHLCDSVFEAAGVPVKSEQSIRFLIKWIDRDPMPKWHVHGDPINNLLPDDYTKGPLFG